MQPQYPGPYPGHHQQYLVNNSDPHRLSPQFFVQHPHYPYASPGLVWGPPHNGPALVGSHFVGVAHPGVYPQQHQWQTQIHHPQQAPHGLPPSPTHSTASMGNIVPQLDVHAFWKQRLAPLPGFCSAPDLFRNPGTTITQAPLPTPPTPPRSLNGKDHDPDDFFELDIHAESYIPQVLKDLQKAPHHFTPLSAVPIYPPASYHEDIPLSKSILKKYTISWSQCETLSRPPVHENIKLVSMLDDYQRHWLTLHAWELCKNADDKKKIILWKTKVHVVDWERSEFSIFVPGIRENYPRLELGDILHLKEVLEDWGEGTFMAFEGRVSLLKKREGHVHFYCPSLRDYASRGHPTPTGQYFGFHKGQPVPQCFNISFLANAGPAISMEIALRTIGTNLSERKTRSLVHRWMYPSPEDLQNNPPVLSRPPHTLGESWVDAGLNPEQRLAASSIALYQSPIPFLISGPPGTGKTRTIVETVHQILRFQPKAHILLCAPSNPATDTLVQRLGTVLAPREMLRLNDPNRTFAEIPDVIRPFCYVPEDDGKFALPPWKSLLKYRVVVTSCLDASMLVEAHLTNAVLGALEDDVMEALHPDDRKPVTPHFTHLLIDEAAQGSEPELLIPISVVYTRAKDLEDPTPSTPGSPGSGYHPLMTTPQLVLCGDSNQLGPIIMSDAARKHDLDVSLLERLFERPVYAKHPEARSKLVKTSNPPLVWQNSGLPNFKPFVNLTKNYRSHPAILMPPSAMFYNDSLEPCASNGLISWAGLPNQLFPVKVIGSYTKEDSVNEKATWYNPGEIERIVEVISELMEEATKSVPPLQAQDIGVMAPWREQVWKLRGALRKAGFAAVDVGSVEDFQGREKRVVIISCVRSTRKYLAEDRAKGIGLVYERKRMNVAITRAKELLVVVGNAGLLSKDPYWKGFLQFAMRNDLYVGPELKIENDGAWISRLESDLIRAQEESGLAKSKDSDDRNAMMLAGGIARDVLRDAEEWPPLPVR